jgi:hypothetical protein
MPDPIDELENFNRQGLHVNPMPASEVRRRGDRMRRRNTALATVGTIAAAVIVIATPLVVVANQNDDRSTPPLPPYTQPTTQTAWLQQIPADFPLTEGFPATNGNDGSPVTVQHPTDLEVFPPCLGLGDKRSHPTPTVDKAGVEYVGESEDQRQAVLAVYQDQETAIAALTRLEDDLAGCTSQSSDGKTYLFDPLPSNLGEQSFSWTMRLRLSGEVSSELLVVQNVRVGNAIHSMSYFGQGGANQEVVDYTARQMATDSAGVVSDMCIFSAEPC